MWLSGLPVAVALLVAVASPARASLEPSTAGCGVALGDLGCSAWPTREGFPAAVSVRLDRPGVLTGKSLPLAAVGGVAAAGDFTFSSLAQPDGLATSDLFGATLALHAGPVAAPAEAESVGAPVPVPLPGAAGLLLLGLPLLLVRRKARRAAPAAAAPAKPKKVLLLSLNFAPELTGIGKYSGEMADGLVARGHEVTVVCAPPHYPRWQVASGYSATGYKVERPQPGLTVYRCPIWIPRRLGGLSRLLCQTSFVLSSLPVVLWLALKRPQVVFAVAPALFCAPVAWLAARLAGAQAWLHVQDFETDAAFELGLLKQAWLRRGALFIERRLLKRFDVVSTLSRRMMRRLAVKGVAMEQAELLPNWVDLDLLKPLVGSDALRHRLGIAPTQTVCLYSGTINRKQGLGVLVETARRLQAHSRIAFVICGNGELRPGLEASAAGLNNLRFLDLQPAAELNALLNMADIHLLPQLRGAADLVMPSKLIGMLASGRPVIAGTHESTEIAAIVSRCGIVTEPECAAGFERAVMALSNDVERRHRLGAAARAHAERHLDMEHVLDGLHQRLQGLGATAGTASTPAARAGGALATAGA